MIPMKDVKRAVPGLRGLALRALDCFFPEAYFAVSTQDFLDEREFTTPTRTWLPLGVFFNGCAYVLFLNSVSFNFNEDKKSGNISDLSGDLDVALGKLNEHQLSLLSSGKRLYAPELVYDCRNDLTYLYSFDEHGPKSTSKKGLETELRDDALLASGLLQIVTRA